MLPHSTKMALYNSTNCLETKFYWNFFGFIGRFSSGDSRMDLMILSFSWAVDWSCFVAYIYQLYEPHLSWLLDKLYKLWRTCYCNLDKYILKFGQIHFANFRILTGWAWSLLSDALFANCLTSFASFGKVVIGSLHKLPHSPPAPMKVGESKSGWPSSTTTTSPIECSPTKNLKEDCRVFKSNGKATLVGLFSPYLHFSEPTALIPNKYISNFWQNIKIIHFKIWTKL